MNQRRRRDEKRGERKCEVNGPQGKAGGGGRALFVKRLEGPVVRSHSVTV